MSELQDVFDQLVVIQEAIATPAGEKPIKKAWDEPPGDIGGAFPCWVSIEDNGSVDRSSGLRRTNLVINMHLLFALASQKYSVRSRRKWLKPVIDAFDGALRLGNALAPLQYAPIEEFNFDPIELNGTPYIAATFVLRTWWAESFTFAP